MAGHKRAFPYYSEIDDFEIKRPAVGVNPSHVAAEPRAFEPRAFDGSEPHQVGNVCTVHGGGDQQVVNSL